MYRVGSAVVTLLCCAAAFAQSFDIAEVKANRSGSDSASIQFLNGQQRLINVSMRLLISSAYESNPRYVKGGPEWLDSDRFDIIAKSRPEATKSELRAMLKTLLMERFKLATHVEEKPTPAFALVVTKGGPKLKESTPGNPEDQQCGFVDGSPEQLHRNCVHMTMAEFVRLLPAIAPRYVTMPVVDKTGLKGSWEFRLDWTPGSAPGGRDADDGPTIETAGGYTLFDALAKVGLKLEQTKLPVPMIMVDHVDRLPSDN